MRKSPIEIRGSLETPRLLLRQWQAEDAPIFADMNSDAEVMEFFPATLSSEESAAAAKRYASHISRLGWGFWACVLKDSNEFIGVVGLNEVEDLPIGDYVEVGWRLAKDHWGKGYATEAAGAALEFAFNDLGLSQVVSITSVINLRSRRVMEKLGMHNSRQNFQHPRLADESPLKEHVLYTISKKQFVEKQESDL